METLDDYLTKLASAEPVPGGGSAAMLVGACGCALVAMTARICARGKKFAAVHALAERLAAQADEARAALLGLREQDEAAFAAVVAARGQAEAMQRALAQAAAAPLHGAALALAALRLANDALGLGNANLVSDVACAAEFAHAALLGCAYNVRINHRFMRNPALVAEQAARLVAIEREGAQLLETVRSAARAAPS